MKEFLLKYKVGNEVNGIVSKKMNNYALVECENSSVKLYNSELNWSLNESLNKFKNLQIGDKITGSIYKINDKNNNVYISTKRQNNESSLQVDKNYQCKIIEIQFNGLIVSIEGTNILGFIKKNNISKDINISLRGFKVDQIVDAQLLTSGQGGKMPLLSIRAQEIETNEKLLENFQKNTNSSFGEFI